MKKIFLYWHTVRHLKLIQVYSRLIFLVFRPIWTSTKINYTLRNSRSNWHSAIERAPSMMGPFEFKFLNNTHHLPSTGGWNDHTLDKLWLYNLHYFDDLNSSDSICRRTWHLPLIKRWIKENYSVHGVGWDSYPTSLRIVNWIKWLMVENANVSGMMDSLFVQANWLYRRIEVHLQGNHLFTNAKALVFAGLFFDGPRPKKWLETGLNIIEHQLPEQVLTDGGNFERSIMYHAIFLEDVMDLINVSLNYPEWVSDSQIRIWRDVALRMIKWLQTMTHPDGGFSFFNDTAFGIAPNLSELIAYAQRLKIYSDSTYDKKVFRLQKITYLEASGYVRMESDRAVAILDVANIGPDYLPGHAHADTLSFELSLFGQRVIVNGGTSCYGIGLQRTKERGTAAHSTVEVAGNNSSEVWGGFRVARRAYPFDIDVSSMNGTLKVASSHNGYTRLSGSPVHRREWSMDTGILRIHDSVKGGSHLASARFIFHPHVKVLSVGNNSMHILLPLGQKALVNVLNGNLRLDLASYAPEFGRIFSTKCLVVDLIKGESQVLITWG